jgi:hypothetical protein
MVCLFVCRKLGRKGEKIAGQQAITERAWADIGLPDDD